MLARCMLSIWKTDEIDFAHSNLTWWSAVVVSFEILKLFKWRCCADQRNAWQLKFVFCNVLCSVILFLCAYHTHIVMAVLFVWYFEDSRPAIFFGSWMKPGLVFTIHPSTRKLTSALAPSSRFSMSWSRAWSQDVQQLYSMLSIYFLRCMCCWYFKYIVAMQSFIVSFVSFCAESLSRSPTILLIILSLSFSFFWLSRPASMTELGNKLCSNFDLETLILFSRA